jgi:predicted metal-dependent hydrolase
MKKAHYLQNKEKARILLTSKVLHYSKLYAVKVNRISIRDQKTRWGSCSVLGNLNFNYRLIFLSEELQNLVVVHEICHLLEFNHSRKFWSLVEKEIPNYRQLTYLLRNTRMPHTPPHSALKSITKRELLSSRFVFKLFR